MGRLDGKVAIVTGGAQGMGRSEARLFAAEGAKVVVADLLDEQAGALADEMGDGALAHHLDVSDEDSWRATLAATEEAFGTPDVLVNNAGILRFGAILDMDRADLDATLAVNLVGPILGMKVVGGAMARAGRGSIINVSSAGGLVGMSMISAYVASKWGLRGVTKSAAIELGAKGVRVNSLHPGGVATPMAGTTTEIALREPPAPGEIDDDPTLAALDVNMRGKQPIGRMGRPLEIARLALFLASDESSYCTGMEFVADGGSTAGQDLGGALQI
jgi:3alpha(or 20beta)-hydroxysteroid dehydrogenase